MTAIEVGEVGHDRQAEARPGLRFVEPGAPPQHPLASFLGQSRTVVLDPDGQERPVVARRRRLDEDQDPRVGPFTRIVDEVADHLLEILAFAAKAQIGLDLAIEGEVAVLRLADPGSPTLVQDKDNKGALYVLMPMRV